MNYREKLNNWAVVRLLPKMQRVVVERFRKESDADGYVKILRQLQPDSEFIVMFDLQSVDAYDKKQKVLQNNDPNHNDLK